MLEASSIKMLEASLHIVVSYLACLAHVRQIVLPYIHTYIYTCIFKLIYNYINLKQQTNNKIYNFKKDLSLLLKRSRLPASTTFLGKSFQ